MVITTSPFSPFSLKEERIYGYTDGTPYLPQGITTYEKSASQWDMVVRFLNFTGWEVRAYEYNSLHSFSLFFPRLPSEIGKETLINFLSKRNFNEVSFPISEWENGSTHIPGVGIWRLFLPLLNVIRGSGYPNLTMVKLLESYLQGGLFTPSAHISPTFKGF